MTFLGSWSSVADRKPSLNRASSAEQTPNATAENVFCAHMPLVYNVARRILGNESDAEDVTQEVFLQVVRKLDSFRGEGRLVAWLRRVTVNAALLHRRKHKRLRQREVVDVPLNFIPVAGRGRRAPKANACPAQQVLDNEMHELIQGAIARLPEIYQVVYVLADIEGLSNAEIAEILAIGVQAVKSRLHRARLMMREALAFYF